MAHDFWVLLDPHSDRAPHWREVLGDDHLRLPVQSPLRHWGHVPGIGRAEFYLVALDVLTDDQRERMAAYLARQSDLPLDEVRVLMAAPGVPVLARECSTIVHNPARWLT